MDWSLGLGIGLDWDLGFGSGTGDWGLGFGLGTGLGTGDLDCGLLTGMGVFGLAIGEWVLGTLDWEGWSLVGSLGLGQGLAGTADHD